MGLSAEQAAHLTRIKAYAPVAEAGGVPGAVMVAQGTVESNWGRSGLSRLGNAYFGVKARASWPGAVYSGSTYELVAGRSVRYPGKNRVYPSYVAAIADACNPVALFRAYPSFEENVRDYVRFYQVNPRYRKALERYAQHRDPASLADDVAFAHDIKAAGYATAADYAHTLARFMELYCQDLLAAGSAAAPPSPGLITVRTDEATLPADAVQVTEDGRVFAHVRTLANLLDLQISWNVQSRTVVITS